MELEEYERRKYLILRNKLSIIKSNLYILDSKKNELETLLNNAFKINGEIAEKENIEEIHNNINDVIGNIDYTFAITNYKI